MEEKLSPFDAFSKQYGLKGPGTNTPVAKQPVTKPEDPSVAFGNFLLQKISNAAAGLQDKNEYGKVTTFDSSPKGAFKDRYKAYGQETYNRVGFDPFINNEQNFTANTSTYDDMKRWLTSAALPMVGLGFMDPLRSYKSAMNGDFGANEASAKDYEYYNMLGYSSRGGVGGFTTNLLNSFSYSAGVMIEGAAEGMLIGAAVGAAAGEGIGAIPGAAIGGLFEGISAATKIPRALYQTAKTIGNLSKAVKGLTAVSAAKSFWNTAKTGGIAVAKALNPLENSTEALLNLSKWKDIDNMTGLARSAKTAGAFWHDMMSINLALSEGRLEGGFSQMREYDRLYNEYYSQNGKEPDEATQKKMLTQAKDAGFAGTMANTALVFYSNKIAFPSITRAKFLKNLPSLNAGKVVGTVGNEFQLVLKNGRDATKATMEKVPINFTNSLKGLVNPRKQGAVALNYFKANIIEGLQEIGQDAISSAVESYYTKTYYDPSVKSYRLMAAALGDGLSKQSVFSETFLSGFAMGSLLQGPGRLVKHGSRLGNRIFKSKATYDDYVKQKSAEADRIVESFNSMTGKNIRHLFNPQINSLANVHLLAKNVDNDDKTTTKEAKDNAHAAFALSLAASIRNGTFDMYIDHLKSYKNATPEEIEEAWELEKGQGQKALDNLDQAINGAKTFKNRYEFAAKRMKPATVKEKFKPGTPEYLKAELYEEAYKEALVSFTFLQDSFDDTLGRLDALYSSLAKVNTISGNPFANFAVLTNNSGKLDREIEMLKTDIELGSQSSEPTTVAEAEQKRELLKSLYEFKEKQEGLTTALFLLNNTGLKQEEILDAFKKEGKDLKQEYADAFMKVLQSMAGTSENKAKLHSELDNAGGFENIFQKLYDTHLLTNDKNILSDYINLLADPAEFYEHVNRNFTWMNKLYNERGEYIKQIVNQEFKTAEENEVLNELSKKGVYVDLDKFADWVEDKRNIPDEFIDTTNNMIINKSSVLYPEYAAIFQRAANATAKPAAGNPKTEKEKFTDRLDVLKKEKSKQLNDAREAYENAYNEETGKTVSDTEALNEEIKNNNETLAKQQEEAQKNIQLLTDALEALNSKDAVKIVNAVEALKTNGVYADKDLEMFLDDIDNQTDDVEGAFKAAYSQLSDKGTPNQKAEAASYILALPSHIGQSILAENALLKEEPQEEIDIESSKAYQVYKEKVDQINAEFDAREKEIKDEFAVDGIDENTVDEITTDTPYDNMPDELKLQIDQEFDAYLNSEGENASLKEIDPEGYSATRANWIELNGKSIIDAYNKKVSDEARARAEQLKKPPYLKYIKKQVVPEDTTLSLNQLYKQLAKTLETGLDAKNKKISPKDLELIKEDLENLAGYLEAIAKTYKPASQVQKNVNTIVERVINRRDEVEDVVDENGKKSRKFKDGPEDQTLERVTTIAKRIAQKITGKEFAYNKKEQILNMFSSILENEPDAIKAAKAFLTQFKIAVTTNYAQFNSKSKLESLEQELLADPSVETLGRLIDKLSFRESSVAGSQVDELIRKFLTLDKGAGEGFQEVKYNGTIEFDGVEYKVSDFMSEQSFNKLFGPGGIVSSIRSKMIDGEFVLFPENLVVFDKNLGITGEIDLLAINGKGELMIIDIKTKKNWDYYELPTNYDNVSHRAQLSIYSTLLYNMTGLEVSEIKILPLQIAVNVDGYISDISKAQTAILDENNKAVKDNADKIKRKQLAPGFYKLDFLPEIEEEGVVKIEPEFKQEETEEDFEEEGTDETEEKEVSENISKVLLGDLVNKIVIHDGKVGRLIVLPDGTYAVQTMEVDKYNILLADLESQKRIAENDPNVSKDYLAILDQSIADVKKDIDAIISEGETTTTTLTYKGKPARNGRILPMNVGLSIASSTTIHPFQISKVNGEILNARFEDENENVAVINNVKYDVNRDKSGAIVSLSYRKNDKAIDDIDAAIKKTIDEINRVSDIQKTQNVWQVKFYYADTIENLKANLQRLRSEKENLVNNNDLVTLEGGAANDFIFALNSLPNAFQKSVKKFKGEDEEKHLKEIDKYGLSGLVSKAITEILDDETYPDALDRLFDGGISAINVSDLKKINKWIDTKVDALYKLSDSVINRGDLVDDISNQINTLLQLKNDLYLIKIVRDGKTKKLRFSKQQSAASKIFGAGTKKVQKGSSVSKIQKSTGGRTEEVSGLPEKRVGNEELKEIVSQAKTTLILPTSTTTTDESLSKISNANTPEELQKAYEDTINNRGDLSITAIQNAYNKRKEELTEVGINTVTKGDFLISKINIFDQDNAVVEVVAKNTKDNTVTVQLFGTKKRKVMKENELMETFDKYSKEAMQKSKKDVVTATPEVVETVKGSKETLDDFAKNSAAQAEIIKKAEESSEEDLINKFINNSKIC